MPDRAILTLNAGSSSLKFAIFDDAELPRRLWSGAIERIGLPQSRLQIADETGAVVLEETGTVSDHSQSLDRLLPAIERTANRFGLVAVGHRVAHGGPDCDCPRLIDRALQAYLQQQIPLAPLHQPANIAGIEAMRAARPDLPQIACFDTAFHHTLPEVAKLSGLPRAMNEKGLRRYGYHGLSCEYILSALRNDGVDVGNEKIIVAHLGNGASMCAISAGQSVETTMGVSTISGLPMCTRSGDIDPGLILYLLAEKRHTAEELTQLLYREAGLLGLSGISRNMQDLLALSEGPATEAVDYFCYHARRHLAGLTASLGGLDRLVFTGGIGANSPRIREAICERLGYLGIALDQAANLSGGGVVSELTFPVMVEARRTDEEVVIARHVHAALIERPMAREA